MVTPILRFDVTTGDWVAFPVGRADRPVGFASVPSIRPTTAYDDNCPFCAGQEMNTPEAVDIEPDPDAPDQWSVRAFANRYPALAPDAPMERQNHGELFRAMGGRGAHEVVVESRHHSRPLALQPVDQVLRLVRLLHRRARALSADTSLEVVQIFKNHGRSAGSSLPHPHFQILAAPVVPRQIRTRYAVAAEYYHAHGESLYSALLRAELDDGSRVVLENEHYVAFAPFASRVPYETWIVPRAPSPAFGLAQANTLPGLAEVMHGLLYRLHVALDDSAYNLTVNGAPRRHVDEPDFIWHMEILPRVSAIAGFEFATGMAINSVLPEAAAEQLRQAVADT